MALQMILPNGGSTHGASRLQLGSVNQRFPNSPPRREAALDYGFFALDIGAFDGHPAGQPESSGGTGHSIFFFRFLGFFRCSGIFVFTAVAEAARLATFRRKMDR